MNYIALDIGTTTIKGVLYNENGNVIKKSFRESKTFYDEIDYMEQDADEIVDLVTEVIKELSFHSYEKNQEIGFLSLSTYMHSIMAVGKNGNPMTRIYLWSDNRSKKYSDEYKRNGKGIEFYKLTGTPIHPMSPLYKLMWMKENERDVFDKAYKFVSIKGYLAYKIVGQYIVDHSIASASGIFNIHKLKWDEDILEDLDINVERLEDAFATTSVFNIEQKDFLIKTGLHSNTKFVIGASDGCLANLGSHGLDKKTAIVTIGTSGAVRLVNNKAIIDSEARTFSYILAEDLYVSGGALNNGGVVFEWVKKLFNQDYDLDEKLKNYKNFNNGLLFLPFLNGERAPYWNPKLKGAYIGLNNTHKDEDILYSTIQGINFAVKDVLSILQSDTQVEKVYANGGFTKSDFWVSRLASILEMNINVLEQGDAACFGAYLLGLKATGKITSWDQCDEYFKQSKSYNFKLNDFDKAMFELYKKSIEINKSICEELSNIQAININ